MGRYIPGNVPTDPVSLPAFLRDDLNKVAQAIETPNPFTTLETLYAAPKKYREGTICLADGSVWNPGSGAGVYCYRGGSWRFLG